jgi:hypothetical protein
MCLCVLGYGLVHTATLFTLVLTHSDLDANGESKGLFYGYSWVTFAVIAVGGYGGLIVGKLWFDLFFFTLLFTHTHIHTHA